MEELAGAIVLLGELLHVAKSWAVRIGVLASLHSHLVLVLMAENRRHQASGHAWTSPLNATLTLDMVEKFVIAKLFTGRLSQEQQLVAFWLPFLLVLVSRPGNISGFLMEETVFSVGQLLSAAAVILGAANALYTHVVLPRAGAGTLLPASIIMYSLGIAKYMERATVLKLGNLSRIKIVIKKNQPARFSFHHAGGRGPLDNEQALLVAHSMFHVTKCAFCDCSVDMDPRDRETGRKIMSRGWESACKVVEMELSLMYDGIYTKAVVIHTWPGYIIRIASPLLIAAALLLFWFYDKDHHARVDIVITYMLLVSTLLLEVRWLLGALGSKWAYAFLKDSRWQLLKDAVVDDGGRWHRLRGFVVSMDLSRMPFFSDLSRLPLNSRYREPPSTCFDMKQPSSYRLWPGVLGQYNLLHECTRHKSNIFRRFMKRFMSEENWMEQKHHYLEGFRIPQDVKGLLFERIWEKLKLSYTPRKVEAEEEKEEGEDVLRFDPDELQEAILIWHMATSIFLQRSSFENEESQKYVRLTSKLSDYMVFLVAIRPGMLPARKLPSKHEATSKALEGLLGSSSNNNTPAAGSKTAKQKLAFILQQMEDLANGNRSRRSSIVLSDGSQYAGVLRSCLERGRYPDLVCRMGEKSYGRFKKLMPRLCRPSELVTGRELLNLIFDAWVRLLMNASRDAHARQLGRGGDLVTVVWILTKHAGVFGIEDADD